jgi:hypothetical protein
MMGPIASSLRLWRSFLAMTPLRGMSSLCIVVLDFARTDDGRASTYNSTSERMETHRKVVGHPIPKMAESRSTAGPTGDVYC